MFHYLGKKCDTQTNGQTDRQKDKQTHAIIYI